MIPSGATPQGQLAFDAAVDRIPDTGFAEYGLDPASASDLRSRMHAWAKKISGS